MRPETLCGLLAEPERQQVYAAVVLGATTAGDVATRTGLPARTVAQALRRLDTGGLVSTVDGQLRAATGAFKDAARRARPQTPAAAPAASDKAAAVLRAFVADGRLRSIPMSQHKRRIVLEHLVTNFEPGVKYPEREVNAILSAWHPDHAALRRYLVDEGLMTRRDSVYHRSGGPVDV